MKKRLALRLAPQVLLFVTVITAVSCTRALDGEQVTAAQLKAYVYGPVGYYSTVFKGVRYAGSDAHFDYIALTYLDTVGGDRVFKVRVGELRLKSRMSVKPNPRDWVDASVDFPFPQPTAK